MGDVNLVELVEPDCDVVQGTKSPGDIESIRGVHDRPHVGFSQLEDDELDCGHARESRYGDGPVVEGRHDAREATLSALLKQVALEVERFQEGLKGPRRICGL